jgi:hypothetical protein
MTTPTPHRRSIHAPGSPSDMKGSHKPASNPDGKTPVDLPTGKKTSLHDQKPPALKQSEEDPSAQPPPTHQEDLEKH